MARVGFHERACIPTISCIILHDGKELGPLVPRRGLSQGDPLSLFLFIVCVEALS